MRKNDHNMSLPPLMIHELTVNVSRLWYFEFKLIFTVCLYCVLFGVVYSEINNTRATEKVVFGYGSHALISHV